LGEAEILVSLPLLRIKNEESAKKQLKASPEGLLLVEPHEAH